MTKSRKRRTSSEEHRSTKRRKHPSEHQPVYSTRIITWEEQLRLPPRFHEEKDVWPALKILKERIIGGKRQYLLQWEAHPGTGEIFEPTWEPADNVGQELKIEWAEQTPSTKSQYSLQQSSPIVSLRLPQLPDVSEHLVGTRRVNNRRIISDSSTDFEEAVIENSAPSKTPTLTGSPESLEGDSFAAEISETQPAHLSTAFRVNVPPAPADKGDWESLRGSQFSVANTQNNLTSPLANTQIDHNSSSLQYNPASFSSPSFQSPIVTTSAESQETPHSSSQPGRGQGIQKILDYQPIGSSTPATTGNIQYSLNSAQLIVNSEHSGSGQVLVAQGGSQPKPKSGVHYLSGNDDRVPESSLTTDAHSSGQNTNKGGTQPWVFKSQIALGSQTTSIHGSVVSSEGSPEKLPGRCARRTISQPGSQKPVLKTLNNTRATLDGHNPTSAIMTARGTRQSPRLQTVVPAISSTSPRIAVRSNSYRARAGLNPPEHSSPLAVTAEIAEPHELTQQSILDSSFSNHLAHEHNSSLMSTIPPASMAPSDMHIDATEPVLFGTGSSDSANYDAELNTLAATVQDSIENERISSAEETSLASKASSSQESLRNETFVPHVDGLVMPSYPILGQDEYVITLPAEGRVRAVYFQTVKVKRKSVLRFIRRRGTVNTAGVSASKTIERNEMIELIDRLHDTTTHLDLGLPGEPTQHVVPSQEHAAYAEYAGSKFVFLGFLMDILQRHDNPIVIMAKPGATQNLIEEYLSMRNVRVRRHDKAYDSHSPDESQDNGPQVELLSTKSNTIVQLVSSPALIIAFDASFESSNPHVKSLRVQSNTPVPIVHLLVANSSEHVERCLPPSMPSPTRLRLLVRATYQASMNLGGSPTIITNPSDEMYGRPMDLADINKAVRKSPNRRLQMVAVVVAYAALSNDFAENWTMNPTPALLLDELNESPSTGSTVSTTPGRNRARSRTPVSRAGTPSGRKRQLEIDTTGLTSKRQRMTPVGERPDALEDEFISTREPELHRLIDSLRVELANERKARESAEAAMQAAQKKADSWHASLANLQRRYEKRTKKSHEQQKANQSLVSIAETSKLRVEKVTLENTALRQQVLQLRKDLEGARTDIKSTGGDPALLEISREEARNALTRAAVLEKSLDNTKHDFEFLRTQYQDASNRAAELGSQVSGLEANMGILSKQASDEKRRLKELNYSQRSKQDAARIQQLEAEKRSLQVMYKKLEEESKLLKRNRGVQTRGSSITPASPGQRSRQASPALGNLAPPSGSRAAVLRHER